MPVREAKNLKLDFPDVVHCYQIKTCVLKGEC